MEWHQFGDELGEGCQLVPGVVLTIYSFWLDAFNKYIKIKVNQ